MLTKEQTNLAAFVEFLTDPDGTPRISEAGMREFEAVTGFSASSNMATVFRAFSAGFDRAVLIAKRRVRRAGKGQEIC